MSRVGYHVTRWVSRDRRSARKGQNWTGEVSRRDVVTRRVGREMSSVTQKDFVQPVILCIWQRWFKHLKTALMRLIDVTWNVLQQGAQFSMCINFLDLWPLMRPRRSHTVAGLCLFWVANWLDPVLRDWGLASWQTPRLVFRLSGSI